MVGLFRKWVDKYFADEEAVALLLMLAVGLLVVVYFGHIVGPVIAAVIIAYLLQGLVVFMRRWFSEVVSVTLTFLLFIGSFLGVILFVVPIIGRQITALIAELPNIASKLQSFLVGLQQKYPSALSEEQLQELIGLATQKIGGIGESLVSFSLASIPNVFALLVYAILIPILVFFFLKDKRSILDWLSGFLPEERPFMTTIWVEMNSQVANYARGKALEILIVGVTTYITFSFMGLRYSALLGTLVGLSVIIPYIGAVVVTIPVAVIAYFQWGMVDSFGWVLLAYGIIQFLDGNVLVPLLFSEAVNMHPVAIIIAVLVFGGLWGLWGVFFAIPLATLIKALLEAWPHGLQSIESIEQESACEE